MKTFPWSRDEGLIRVLMWAALFRSWTLRDAGRFAHPPTRDEPATAACPKPA